MEYIEVFECVPCKMFFSSRDESIIHLLTAHTIIVTCQLCKKKFKNKGTLKIHMQKHIALRRHKVLSRINMDQQCLTLSNHDICWRIADANNMTPVFVDGGDIGSCQYSAVIEGLAACGYVPKPSVSELRKMAFHEITTNAHFSNFVLQSFDEYTGGIINNEWGDQLTIEAIAKKLQLYIHIYSFTMKSQYVSYAGNKNSRYHIYLTLDNRNEHTAHYGTLVMKESEDIPSATEHTLLKNTKDFGDKPIDDDTASDAFNYECSITLDDIPSLPIQIGVGINEFEKPATRTQYSHSETATVSRPTSSKPILRRSSRISNNVQSLPTESQAVENGQRQQQKEQCVYCKRKFTSLDNHKKCQKRDYANRNVVLLDSTADIQTCSNNSILESDSVIIQENAPNILNRRRSLRISTKAVSLSKYDNSDKGDPEHKERKQQCIYCKKLFKNLNLHKKCRKREMTLTSSQNNTKTAATSEQKLQHLKEQNPPWTEEEMECHDPNYIELKKYHDFLSRTSDSFTTQKISARVNEVIDTEDMNCRNPTLPFTWSKSDESMLNELSCMAKQLSVPKWPWAAADNTTQGRYNHSRFQFLVDEQLKYKIFTCPRCKCTSLLIGLDEISLEKCRECVQLDNKVEKNKKLYEEAWEKVKPTVAVPVLPQLNAAEQAVISLVQPIVTIKKNFLSNRKYRQESINLLHNAHDTWCKIVPRTNLNNRFIIIERRFKNSSTVKYMVADPEKVRIWLNYLFQNHTVYMKKLANNEIALSEEAIDALQKQSELASVDYDNDVEDVTESTVDTTESPPPSSELDSGLSRRDSYSFDKHDYLYMSKRQALKVTGSGRIEITADSCPERKPIYDPHVPVSMVFPSLYPNAEQGPSDFGQHALARYLLKKQSQFAQINKDGHLQWTHGEHGVHMMHQYARIVEMNVRSVVGWYISIHPDKSHIPVQSLLDSFKQGLNSNQGYVDTQLPGLQGVMTSIRNSREKWFSERLGIETMGRDLSDCNLFFTLNSDVRANSDVRQLLFELHEGQGTPMPPDYYVTDTDKFTELLDKYAIHIAVYLSKKAQLFMETFFDICHVSNSETEQDTTKPQDRTKNGWYWARVEFTQTRGCSHWHCLTKLPNILDTAILSQMVQDMRILRTELKHCNIKNYDKAWYIIKMGLIATRYLVLFSDSISMSSFFTENMDSDHFDESKVIDVEAIRSEFVRHYISKNISKKTYPIMRKYNDAECNSNVNVEMASVAATSCVHNCIESICGGDPATGKNCRFSFPMKLMKKTVVAVMDVMENQVEVQIIHRRTHGRVPNLQKYFLQYYRANHDFTPLVDASHKMRYASKYVSKSGQIETLLSDVIENLERRQSTIAMPNVKQTLTSLMLAECSHRTYMTKQELAYNVMDLPQVIRSFPKVKTVGHYPRAIVIEQSPDSESGFSELSDRTDYSAYSERCLDATVITGELSKDELKKMNLREFAESVNFRWVLNRKKSTSDLAAGQENEAQKTSLKWRCRDRLSGHWIMSKKAKFAHVRSSTFFYTDQCRNYVPDDNVTRFFDLPRDRQLQLKRLFQELVLYVPWEDDPDKWFLSSDVIEKLEKERKQSDEDGQYELHRLHEYWKFYMELLSDDKIAPIGSQWHRDNQYSYTMYLASRHNKSIHEDRVSNNGMLVARYEEADELEGSNLEIRTRISSENDNDEYPSVFNYLPCDVLEEIENQDIPTIDEIRVAFPDNRRWTDLKESVSRKSNNLFMANPSEPDILFSDLTPMQQHAINLMISGKEKIVYLVGKAGSGKTAVGKHLAWTTRFRHKTQAAAGTGKASSLFRGPTIFGCFMLSIHGVHVNLSMTEAKKQILRNFYEKTDLFIFDEINACGADLLFTIDETMKELFCRVDGKGKRIDEPFGGKYVLFMGDSGQLRPVNAAAIYDNAVNAKKIKYRSVKASKYLECAQAGQAIYRKYLMKKCIYLRQGKRNSGILQQIMDRLRDGSQTDDDLDKIIYMRQKHPNYITDRGIHYSNDSAAISNCRQLWEECQQSKRRVHICRATYKTENEQVIRILSSLPASDYYYAPDTLCLADGCEVRLIKNLDTSAGLVTNSVGRVVEIIYDNRDVPSLLNGEYPPPYCVIVTFPDFIGFVSNNNERRFPLSNHTLVPIYRMEFPAKKIPDSIRKSVVPRLCYRQQFPLDLSTNLTAHRGQGQTWKNCTLSVNLGFESPDSNIPPDATAIAYVACTRINKLSDLFVSPIFPTIWQKMGKGDRDVDRRKHEAELTEAFKNFASDTGQYQECLDELNFNENYDRVDIEWKELKTTESTPRVTSVLMSDADILKLKDCLQVCGQNNVQVCLKPCDCERYIGIDQGLKTFSMVAIDKRRDSLPTVVGIFQINLVEFGLLSKNRAFTAMDVLLILENHSPLFEWMQSRDHQSTTLQKVDRIVVLLEQIPPINAYSEQLGKDLGCALQRNFDVNTCIVKLSQPHVHRRNGPMFKLGKEIAETCNLKSASYDSLNTRVSRKRTQQSHNLPSPKLPKRSGHDDDVEPSKTDDECSASEYQDEQHREYMLKKSMSAAIFKYFVNATDSQQMGMQVQIEKDVQTFWRDCLTLHKLKKCDDLGDALLHALNEILCSGSNYRQLISPSTVLQKNRTIVLVLLPSKVFWTTTECICNKFVLQDYGVHNMSLHRKNYSANSTANFIKSHLPYRLRVALTQFDPICPFLNSTEYIQVIVKQLKQNTNRGLNSRAAGALTNVVVKTITSICDDVLPDSTLHFNNDKKSGWRYSRKCTSGRLFSVSRSSGKHLNAVISCIQWMKENVPDFVRDRKLKLTNDEKDLFFNALLKCSSTTVDKDSVNFESIHLSRHAVDRFLLFGCKATNSERKIIADLILISLNNNQQYIRALSDNYRRQPSC